MCKLGQKRHYYLCSLMKKAESECFQLFLFFFTCYSTSFCLVGVIHAVKHLTSAQFSKSRVLVHSSRVEPVVFISSISKILISVTSTELFSLKLIAPSKLPLRSILGRPCCGFVLKSFCKRG